MFSTFSVELGGLRRTDTEILKHVLHSGLRKNLKHLSTYHCDKASNYDEFKVELRRLEADMKDGNLDERKPCKPVVALERKEKEDSEMKQLLKQISERIEKLEKGQASQTELRRNWNSGERNGRGWQGGNPKQRGRGRGSYGYTRAEDTFTPECFICKQKGHVQRKCPIILAQLVCSKCKQKGHQPQECPN